MTSSATAPTVASDGNVQRDRSQSQNELCCGSADFLALPAGTIAAAAAAAAGCCAARCSAARRRISARARGGGDSSSARRATARVFSNPSSSLRQRAHPATCASTPERASAGSSP